MLDADMILEAEETAREMITTTTKVILPPEGIKITLVAFRAHSYPWEPEMIKRVHTFT